eukprot:COSAG01_NODE_41461_length_451_cov_0.965909_1_plen_39_part_10
MSGRTPIEAKVGNAPALLAGSAVMAAVPCRPVWVVPYYL